MRAAAIAVVLAGCTPAAPTTTRPAPLEQVYTLRDLAGTWRWILHADDRGTSRTEDEEWQFRPVPGSPDQLVGRYTRSVEVRSLDKLPFACNQHPTYRQRAVFDVAATLETSGRFTVVETGYRTEPGPCDHGFRHVGTYVGQLAGGKLALTWDGGDQTLLKTDDVDHALVEPPWPAKPELAGTWRWDASSVDDDGNQRDETEWWEITRRTETRLDATYRRRVVVHALDGKPITCANAPQWRFDDAYILEGQRDEDHWHFVELAATPGDHPCLRATPRRALDESNAEQLGDYLLLEWRGKRRQVLHR